MGRARQRKRTRPKSSRPSVLTSRAIGKGTLAVSILTLFVALVTYYLAYEGPDLRFVPVSADVAPAPPVIDNQGHCFYYVTADQPFKNVSFKKGFVKDIQVSPGSLDAFSQISLVSIDSTPLGWHEQKNVRFKFGISLTPEFCDRPEPAIPFKVLVYYYDQTGQRIQADVNGNPFITDIDLNFVDPPQGR